MEDVKKIQYLDAINLIGGIRNNKSYQNKLGHSTLLIKDLEIRTTFKDKTKEKGAGITDFIYRTV